MSEMLKISMVSYINSKPFQLGMELTGLIDNIELHLEVPAITAEKLKNKEVDIALVPVAALPDLKHVSIITDYCIGSINHVDSVLLMSEVPLADITTIYLDSHSRTSANLIQILIRKYWKKQVHFIADTKVNKELVKGTHACLMIGDKALANKDKFSYQFDLANAWYEMTGLPFVFAVWVATEEGKSLEDELNKAFKIGINDVNQVAAFYENIYPSTDIKSYLSESISYDYSKAKAKALDLFLEYCKENTVVLY